MNSVIEKEKKLNLALTKLKNLNLQNPNVKKNIENLSEQRNQLEIEKQAFVQANDAQSTELRRLQARVNEFQKS